MVPSTPESAQPNAAHSDAVGLDPSTWLAEHGDALFGYALKRVRDRSTAEDLVQETLLAALRPAQPFEGRSAVRTWLFGILRHKILDHWRLSGRFATGRDEELGQRSDDLFGSGGHWKRDRAPGVWAARGDERDEIVVVLRQCLEKLPPRAAETFLLRERHGVSIEQISQDLGTNPTNVWQILSRARSALRQCLERGGVSDSELGRGGSREGGDLK